MIMKNKKHLLACLLIVASSFFLTACHGTKSLDEFCIPESFDESQDIEISFWAKNDSNKYQIETYKSAIESFEKLYPNVHVTLRQYTDYGRIYNDVITNISTNTTPNVCITYPDHIATYMTGNNVVLPLNDIMNDERYGLGGSEVLFDSPSKDDIISTYLEEGSFSGNYYALPFMRSTEACYINKDYVEELGYEIPDILTWDFIWEVSEKAMEQNPDGTYKLNNQNVMIPFIYKSTDNMMITMLKQQNAGYSTENAEIEIFNDTTTQTLLEIASHAKTGAFSTFKISSYPANFLNAGQCIFAIDSTAGSTWMGADAPLTDIAEEAKIEFETVVRPVPQYDTSSIKMMSQGPSLCIFNKENPQEVLASWLFAQYLLTNEIQISYSTTEGYIPVTQKAINSSEYQDYLSKAGSDKNEHYQIKMDATKLLIENTQNTFVTPVFNGSASLRNAAGALIEDVTKSVRRKKNVDEEFIKNEYESVNSLYRLNQIRSNISDNNKDLGPLPITSKILIGSLIFAWILILSYLVWQRLKTKSKK